MLPCEICLNGPFRELQLTPIPERAPRDLDSEFECAFQLLCPRCLDGLLGVFPLKTAHLLHRELRGRFPTPAARGPRRRSGRSHSRGGGGEATGV